MALLEVDVPIGQTRNSERQGDSRPAFAFNSAEELSRPLQPRSYLVDSLVCRGSLIVVGGYGGSAKTWLALSLAYAVAQGKPWLGRFQVEQSMPSLLDFESGEYETRRRLHALHAGSGGGVMPKLAVCVHPSYTLNSPEFAQAVEQALETSPLLVCDSLRAATPGLDENESSIRQPLDALRRVANFERSAIIILAHARKGGTGDLREQLRGSGATHDAADQVYFIKAEEDEVFSIRQVKNRFGPSNLTLRFQLEDVGSNGVRLDEVPTFEGQTLRVDAKLMMKVREEVSKHPGIGAAALRARAGRRAEKTDAAARQLVEEGIIERHNGLYFLRGAKGNARD